MKTIKLGRGYPLCFIVAAIAGVGTFPAIAEIAEDVRSAVFAGQQGPAFQARTVDGLTVNFPSDYKGGVVLLDFWALPPGTSERGRHLPKISYPGI